MLGNTKINNNPKTKLISIELIMSLWKSWISFLPSATEINAVKPFPNPDAIAMIIKKIGKDNVNPDKASVDIWPANIVSTTLNKVLNKNPIDVGMAILLIWFEMDPCVKFDCCIVTSLAPSYIKK